MNYYSALPKAVVTVTWEDGEETEVSFSTVAIAREYCSNVHKNPNIKTATLKEI